MRLGFRIFLLYLAIFAVCFYYATDWIWTTLRTRYLESVEEPLVDAANLIAAQVTRWSWKRPVAQTNPAPVSGSRAWTSKLSW